MSKDEDIYTIYVLKMDDDAVMDFAKVSAESKRITLEIEERDPKNVYKVLGKLKYEFYISNVTKNKDYNDWTVKAGKGKRLSGDLPWPNSLPADLVFTTKLMNKADILDKSGKSVATLTFVGDEFEDCFITTACVQERGKDDDCYELNTLRFLRENYMRKTTGGKVLLEEYEWLGPAVVAAIGQCENRSDIYDYLYQHMIMPSVHMIKEKRYQDAVDWYEGFTLQLKENFQLI